MELGRHPGMDKEIDAVSGPFFGSFAKAQDTHFCAFASKSELKTAYICISNCPGYGGQVA
jgi:hypothetical protein